MMLFMKDSTSGNNTDVNKMRKMVNRKVCPISEAKSNAAWAKMLFVQQQQIINPARESTLQSLARTAGDAAAGSWSMMDKNERESFHCAIGSTLIVAQCFGLLPLHGVRSETPRKLQFKILSIRAFYSFLVMALLLTMSGISILHMLHTLGASTFSIDGGVGAATAGAVFYGNGLVGTILFVWLAPRWLILQRKWRAMERLLDSDKYEPPRLRWKFSAITAVVMISALVEHLLSIVSNMPSSYWSSSSNKSITHFLQIYSEKSHAFVFTYCDYNLAMGIFIFVTSKVGTFTWNFTDTFVMMVSTGLAERYKSLNQRLINNSSSNQRKMNWGEFREYYATLSSLVKSVDNDVSPIILLSFANNLYFICLQLLNGLSPSRDGTIINSIYFFGSFVFLVGRTSAVTLFTARINDQSTMALPALYNCPGSTFNVETERLQQQLTSDVVCLTGLRFFSISRNFMLAVAGAIVTYEVVLLQFNVAMNK